MTVTQAVLAPSPTPVAAGRREPGGRDFERHLESATRTDPNDPSTRPARTEKRPTEPTAERPARGVDRGAPTGDVAAQEDRAADPAADDAAADDAAADDAAGETAAVDRGALPAADQRTPAAPAEAAEPAAEGEAVPDGTAETVDGGQDAAEPTTQIPEAAATSAAVASAATAAVPAARTSASEESTPPTAVPGSVEATAASAAGADAGEAEGLPVVLNARAADATTRAADATTRAADAAATDPVEGDPAALATAALAATEARAGHAQAASTATATSGGSSAPVPAGEAQARGDGAVVAAPTPVASTPAPAVPAPAPPSPTPPLAPQLAPQLAHLRQLPQGEHVLTLRVDPEHFGPVKIVAHITAEGTTLQLISPTEAGREALRAALADLRRDLAATGMDADLELGSEQDERGEPERERTGDDPRALGLHPSGAPPGHTVAATTSIATPGPAGSRGVDLYL